MYLCVCGVSGGGGGVGTMSRKREGEADILEMGQESGGHGLVNELGCAAAAS